MEHTVGYLGTRQAISLTLHNRHYIDSRMVLIIKPMGKSYLTLQH